MTEPASSTSGGRAPIDRGTSALTAMPAPAPAGGDAPRADGRAVDAPWAGAVPVASGVASVVRIPVPGTNGLCIEFRPRGWTPSGGSTSTVFFQDVSGKRHLRLDYGYNVKTRSVNYHWNQSGTNAVFGIADHTTVGPGGAALYRAAKAFRYAGRVLLIAGVAIDVIEIVRSDRPLRRASQAVVGWAAAWAGCEVAGAVGAGIGSLGTPVGTLIGGVGGCIVGGAAGYFGGSLVAGEVYDWAEDTRFTPLPAEALP